MTILIRIALWLFLLTLLKKRPAKKPAKKKSNSKKKPDLRRLYQRKRPPFDVSDQEFRTTLIRANMPRRQQKVRIDGLVESIEWRAEAGDPVLQGTIVIRKPDLGESRGMKITDGHVVLLQVKWGGKWREVWRMRMYDGQKTLQGQWTWELADGGRILQESTDKWHFTKSKKKGKPKGWKSHQIVREVAKRYKIPLGKVAAGKHFITDISGEMSPMQVIQKAYAIERQATGRRYVIQWRNGKLNILPMRRNPLLYQLGPMIEDATITREERDEKFATAVTVRATVKRGKRRKKKITFLYQNKKAIKKDGFIHRSISGGNVKDKADAIKKAKRYIHKHSVRKEVLESVQHRGIAFIRRGDMIQVLLKDVKDLKGRKSVCFVKSGTWSLAGGEFTMNLDVTFDDPYETPKKKRKAKDKKKRKQKSAKRRTARRR